MEINNYSIEQAGYQRDQLQTQNAGEDLVNLAGQNNDKAMEEAIGGFVSLFLQQMFKSMRSTVPEGGIIDGGYGEEIFTEMLDEEISKAGASQDLFKDLNRSIYNQLNGTGGDIRR